MIGISKLTSTEVTCNLICLIDVPVIKINEHAKIEVHVHIFMYLQSKCKDWTFNTQLINGYFQSYLYYINKTNSPQGLNGISFRPQSALLDFIM